MKTITEIINNNRPYVMAVLITQFKGYSISASELMEELIKFLYQHNNYKQSLNESSNIRYFLGGTIRSFKLKANFNKIQ